VREELQEQLEPPWGPNPVRREQERCRHSHRSCRSFRMPVHKLVGSKTLAGSFADGRTVRDGDGDAGSRILARSRSPERSMSEHRLPVHKPSERSRLPAHRLVGSRTLAHRTADGKTVRDGDGDAGSRTLARMRPEHKMLGRKLPERKLPAHKPVGSRKLAHRIADGRTVHDDDDGDAGSKTPAHMKPEHRLLGRKRPEHKLPERKHRLLLLVGHCPRGLGLAEREKSRCTNNTFDSFLNLQLTGTVALRNARICRHKLHSPRP
jgi:hypothetical protein